MDIKELADEMKGIKTSIDKLSNDVRDLKTSVHGNSSLNINGVTMRLTQIECTQNVLRASIKVVEDERAATKHWMKGAAWVAGSVVALLGIGGGFSVNRILDLLQAIAASQ